MRALAAIALAVALAACVPGSTARHDTRGWFCLGWCMYGGIDAEGRKPPRADPLRGAAPVADGMLDAAEPE